VLTPVTTPVVLTVTTAELLLLHAPPVTVTDKVEEAPVQTAPAPDIAPADGIGLTVIAAVALDVPQVPLTV
jgi:hypothetical protein